MKRLLIDTNILIYLFYNTLDRDTDALVRDYENQVLVSSVSVMEFVHLLQNGRIKSKHSPMPSIIEFIEHEWLVTILYPTRTHLQQLERLPLVIGHNDPNDRLIISQAMADKLELVSSDLKFVHYRKYGLQLIKAEHYGK